MRHTLSTLQNAQARRGLNQTVTRAGGAAIQSSANRFTQSENLWTVQSGTVYDVFILGLHNIDDTEVTRWTP